MLFDSSQGFFYLSKVKGKRKHIVELFFKNKVLIKTKF